MIKLSFLFSILLFAATPLQSSFAEDSPETNAQSPKTEVIADNAAGTVRIVIDGETVGIFTKDGLYVPGDIYFGGTITDTGSDNIKKKFEDKQNAGGAHEE